MADPLTLDRDEVLLRYLDTLPYDPFPVQEDALMRYFESDTGVLVCAPTGTGKTLIAEGALYEALLNDRVAYYTTPLIALTDQKFAELQDAAERWGFDRDRVGLVTGSRSVNPEANILVVVAEILFNRLLQPHGEGRFDQTAAVVMDEFHSFSEPGRGMVWELSLSLMPAHVRVLLLSATVGNAVAFLTWLRVEHGRRLELVQSTDRKVPLTYAWVGDTLLSDHLVEMAQGEEAARRTPALVFCFDRARCWALADVLRGKDLLRPGQQDQILERLESEDLSTPAGTRLRRLLLRGVGVHHAGILPRYKRLVETLFQERLLAVTFCTETLAAGMNLPARSVVLTDLLKGPRDRKRLIAASQAHQIFGRAGRPRFDTEGFVYAVAHDDDVKIAKHRLKIEQIPEDTRDPQLLKTRKRLIKKMPKRREGVSYPTEAQFEALQAASPGDLVSRGHLPWRLLASMLAASPEVDRLHDAVDRRLMAEGEKRAAHKELHQMLLTLHRFGVVVLTPPPPPDVSRIDDRPAGQGADAIADDTPASEAAGAAEADLLAGLTLGGGLSGNTSGQAGGSAEDPPATSPRRPADRQEPEPSPLDDEPSRFRSAKPMTRLHDLLSFRAVNPVFGMFLLEQMGGMSPAERLQVLEGLLELPRSVAARVRPPRHEDLPPTEAVRERIDLPLLQAGLVTDHELYPPPPREQDLAPGEPPIYPIALIEKLRLLFRDSVEATGPLVAVPAYAAGYLLELDGDFDLLIRTRDLADQEGLVFRHLLRLALLCDEFLSVTPAGIDLGVWASELQTLRDRLTEICRGIDPMAADETGS